MARGPGVERGRPPASSAATWTWKPPPAGSRRDHARRFKDGLYEQFARVGKAVAAPKRVELLDLLGQGPRTVEALAGLTAISVANASQHLQVLRAARLVEARKRGLYVEYSLADDEVGRFFVALRGLAAARLAEVEQVTRAYC